MCVKRGIKRRRMFLRNPPRLVGPVAAPVQVGDGHDAPSGSTVARRVLLRLVVLPPFPDVPLPSVEAGGQLVLRRPVLSQPFIGFPIRRQLAGLAELLLCETPRLVRLLRPALEFLAARRLGRTVPAAPGSRFVAITIVQRRPALALENLQLPSDL